MDGWTYRKRRGGNLIVKEILSVHSNGCDVWWMMILNALNSQTGFGIKLGGGREAVVSACKNLIDLRSLWSPLLVVTHLRTHGCDSAPQQPIPEWCKLHGVCVCIHEKDRERERVWVKVKSITLGMIMNSLLRGVVGEHSWVTQIYSPNSPLLYFIPERTT